MFLLKPARSSDLEALHDLARHLDSPNLPRDKAQLSKRLELSERAFAEPGPSSEERQYQFVLVDDGDHVIGTCAILSKHGTPELPHLYLRVREEERHAASVEVSMHHKTLQLEASTDGPTEIGALVLHPEVRGQAGWPGKLLSWGRFAFMALHPGCFEQHVLAEMRASLDPAGRSAFWDAFGKNFTGMSYAEADRRSAHDKAFILDLFPQTPFYASLLDDEVADQLGQVHPETIPALRLLEKAGLRWIGEIDPFDAGPFYGAPVADVIPIRETQRARIEREAPPEDAVPWIVATEEGGSYRAIAARADVNGDRVRLAKEACKLLELSVGDEVWLTPMPPSQSKASTRG